MGKTLEKCPQCNGTLRGINYDMQFCSGDGCNWQWKNQPYSTDASENATQEKRICRFLYILRKIEDVTNSDGEHDGDYSAVCDKVNALSRQALWSNSPIKESPLETLNKPITQAELKKSHTELLAFVKELAKTEMSGHFGLDLAIVGARRIVTKTEGK